MYQDEQDGRESRADYKGKIKADGTRPSGMCCLHVGWGGTRRAGPRACGAGKPLLRQHQSRASSHRLVSAWPERRHGGA